MGITREDLVYNIARHVDSTVHLFENGDYQSGKMPTVIMSMKEDGS